MVKERYPKPHPHDKRMTPSRKRFWSVQVGRERRKVQEAFQYYDMLIMRLKLERNILAGMPWYNRLMFLFLGRWYGLEFSEVVSEGELAETRKLSRAWEALAGNPRPFLPIDYSLDDEGTVTIKSSSIEEPILKAIEGHEGA
jgi:hypothetical protein